MRDECKVHDEHKHFDYLMIPELHKSGAVHFHGLLGDIPAHFVEAANPKTGKPVIRHSRQVYNLPEWGYGFSDCEEIESPERAASYITKYVTAALLTDKEMYNKKRYFNSQGLERYKNRYLQSGERPGNGRIIPDRYQLSDNCGKVTQVQRTTIKRKGGEIMNRTDVPIWEKYTLTIEEASKYFRIGENKLRKLAGENPTAGWIFLNGNRIQIKRKKFEKIIDTLDAI